MDLPRPALEPAPPTSLGKLIQRYGCPVSTALVDPGCALYVRPEGVIGYHRSWKCAVALGEPVCPAEGRMALAEAFYAHCQERGWHTVFAVVGPEFAAQATARGWAAVEWGQELLFDPSHDPLRGDGARDLRKKVHRALKAGATVSEYQRSLQPNPMLEHELDSVATEWLDARRGPQIYLSRVLLFLEPQGKRWLYAHVDGRPAGLLSLMQLDSEGGYLLDHLLARPNAPVGTTELLVVSALQMLGREGVSRATFGPAPGAELGQLSGLGPLSVAMARSVYRAAGRVFHLDSKAAFRRKFRVERTRPSFLVFARQGVGPREVAGVLKAFHASLA